MLSTLYGIESMFMILLLRSKSTSKLVTFSLRFHYIIKCLRINYKNKSIYREDMVRCI